MKILVTGSAGHIGSVLTPMLDATGYDLVGDGIRGDIENRDLFAEAVKGKDVVIHLAALSNNDEYEANILRGDHVNKLAFGYVLKASMKAGVKRFIFASSVAAYGTSDKPLSESAALRPTTLYGMAKSFCEDFILASPLNGMCAVRVRSASVCGASPKPRYDITINKMVHDAMTQGEIKVNGGEQVRAHVHIKDLCDFYAILVNAPEHLISGHAFNVVKDNQMVKESAKLVAAKTGAKVTYLPYSDNRSYMVSGNKARDVLGWQPRRTIEDAIEELWQTLS